MWFSIVALLMVALSAVDGAETPSIRLWQVDGNHIPDIIYGREDGIVEAILR